VCSEGGVGTRVLVTYEEELAIYGEVLAKGIGTARPHLEMAVAESAALEEKMNRFAPHLLICNSHISADAASVAYAWVELSPGPLRPSRIRVLERYWEKVDLTFDELLAVVDEVEGRVAPGNDR